MANVLVQESSLQGIAAAIREKNGTATTYKPAQMAEAISAIETGGGFYPSLLIAAPTGHTITATNGVDTVTLSEISEGQYWGEVTDYGEWTVIDDGGGDGPTLTITEVAEYTGEVTYPSTTLNDNDWATISKVSQAGTGANYWSIGDAKEITLNGNVGDFLTLSNKNLCVFILGFNHKDNNVDRNGILWGGFKTAINGGVDVSLVDSKYSPDASWATYTNGSKCFTMNHKGISNKGGWKGCDFRYDILGATSTQPANYNGTKADNNAGYDATAATLTSPVANTLLAAFPADLRAVMKLRTHYIDNVGNSSNVDANVTAVVDAISLLAEFEIFGKRSGANQYEQNHQAQVAYYTNGNAKIRYKPEATTTAVIVWECSPHYSNAADFRYVAGDGSGGSSGTYFSLAVGPAFLT